MNQSPRFLITGGTGFLGKRVLERLKGKAEVDVLSRSQAGSLRGDLTKWDGGLNIEEIKKKKYDAFIHLAALYDLRASSKNTLLQNVAGTGTALTIASQGQIPVFLNASSIAAVSNWKGAVASPYDLHFTNTFHDPYSESKALAESQIIHWQGPLRLKLNLRLGVLVGDSNSGEIERIDGPYHAPRVFKQLSKFIESWPMPILPVPGNEKVRLPFVPVDVAADAIVRILEWALQAHDESGYKSFHVVPSEGLPVRDFYESCLRFLQIKHPRLYLTSHLPKTLTAKLGSMTLGFPEEQLRYTLNLPKFDSDDTRKILGDNWCPEFPNYEPQFWSGYENFISNRRS